MGKQLFWICFFNKLRFIGIFRLIFDQTRGMFLGAQIFMAWYFLG